jgi:hypothetical protein
MISSWRPELARGLRQASLVQVRCKSHDDSSTAPTLAAVHPIGWIHGLYPASRVKTLLTHVGPKASDPERHRHHRWHQVSINDTQVRFQPNKLWLAEASQGPSDVGRSRAPEANICRRLLLDKLITARLLPKR